MKYNTIDKKNLIMPDDNNEFDFNRGDLFEEIDVASIEIEGLNNPNE